MELREVSGKQGWEQFIEVPFVIFKNDPIWVPPLRIELRKILNPDLNPFFKHAQMKAWVVVEGKSLLGRIAAFIDQDYNQIHHCSFGFIGFFDVVDDGRVADLLFQNSLNWLLKQGMSQVMGPVNLSIGNECGVQLNGFGIPPKLQMNYSPPYYRVMFENAGFQKEHDLLAYSISSKQAIKDKQLMDRLQSVSDRVLSKEGIRIRSIDLKNFDKEVESIRLVFNESMQHNWGFVPMSKEEAGFIGKSMKQIIDKELILIAEVNGEVAGFSLTLPDFNQALHQVKDGRLLPFGIFKLLYYSRKINEVRLYLMGMREVYRRKGLDVIFYQQTIMRAFERGYVRGECSWISEDNHNLIKILDTLGAECYKTYRVYRKDL